MARCLLLCRFSDAGMTRPSTRSGGRRLKSAKARNRGKWGTVGAAGAMGIWPRPEVEEVGSKRLLRSLCREAWVWVEERTSARALRDEIGGATAEQFGGLT